MNCQKFIVFNCFLTPIVCVLFVRTQLKQEGFFASNSKYVVCDISTFCEFNMCNFQAQQICIHMLKCDAEGFLW